MTDNCNDGAPMNNGGQFWTRKQAAQALGVHVRTLDNWCRDLGLPFSKVGNKVRLERKKVFKFMASRAGLGGCDKKAKPFDKENGNDHSGLNGSNPNNGKTNGNDHGANGKADGGASGTDSGDASAGHNDSTSLDA